MMLEYLIQVNSDSKFACVQGNFTDKSVLAQDMGEGSPNVADPASRFSQSTSSITTNSVHTVKVVDAIGN